MSLLASVRLPYLRRPESTSSPDTISKAPLLTLNFSSHSLIDSTLKDDASLSPLYTITTAGVTTTINRADPGQKPVKAASIRWPRIIPAKSKDKSALDGVLVQLKGHHWNGGDSFLRPSTFKSESRKFNLPYYPHSMKWQKQGAAYWCNSSPVRGPIAVFNPPDGELPARLSVYETLHDERNVGPMLLHQGVSIFLLDHLLITAILLVCDPQEWIVAQSASSSAISIGDMQSSASLQTAHREPLSSQPSSPTRQRFSKNTTPSQMSNCVYRDSRLPQIRPELKSMLSFSSDDDDDITCSGPPGSASHVVDQSLNRESWPTERNALPSRNDKRLTFVSEPNPTTESSVGPSSIKRRPSEPALHAYSVRRPLPQTPTTLGGDSRVIRRVQSHIRSETVILGRLSGSPPPLPPIPTPTSSGTGRLLPPTPCDLSMGGSMGRQDAPTASGVQVHRKSFGDGEDTPRWIQLLGGDEERRSDSVLPRTSFEQLPPAYSSLDFGASHQGS